jgi:hypothetical protein
MLVSTEIHRERMARLPSRRSRSYGPRRRQQRHTGVVGSTQGRRRQGTARHTRLVSAGLVGSGARATLPCREQLAVPASRRALHWHNALPVTRKATAERSSRSSATPIRRERTICSAGATSGMATQRRVPHVTSHPFRARSIANARHRFPGPLARAAWRSVPRRRGITSSPRSGCIARSSTALETPSPSVRGYSSSAGHNCDIRRRALGGRTSAHTWG